jgi:ATP-dependent protease ClpP protease subunit
MKYFLLLLILLMACTKPIPSIPAEVLAEMQVSSSKVFNFSFDVDWLAVSQFDKHIQDAKPGDTVLMYISSNGGDVDAAEAIITRMSRYRTICVADFAASAAFEIYQHCTIRVFRDNTLLMVHHHYLVFGSKTTATVPEVLIQGIKSYAQEYGLLNRCAARMYMTYEELIKKIADDGGEWYINGARQIKSANAGDYHVKDEEYENIKKSIR